MGWSGCLSRNGDRKWVSYLSTVTPLLQSSRKTSAGSDTACGSAPCLCLLVVPYWERGYSGLWGFRRSPHSPWGEALPWQSGSNGALSAGKCPVYQVNAAPHHLLLKQKSKSWSSCCVGYQWYPSVLATVLQQKRMSTPATVTSWQIAPCYSASLPWEDLSGFSLLFVENGMGKGHVQSKPCPASPS